MFQHKGEGRTKGFVRKEGWSQAEPNESGEEEGKPVR